MQTAVSGEPARITTKRPNSCITTPQGIPTPLFQQTSSSVLPSRRVMGTSQLVGVSQPCRGVSRTDSPSCWFRFSRPSVAGSWHRQAAEAESLLLSQGVDDMLKTKTCISKRRRHQWGGRHGGCSWSLHVSRVCAMGVLVRALKFARRRGVKQTDQVLYRDLGGGRCSRRTCRRRRAISVRIVCSNAACRRVIFASIVRRSLGRKAFQPDPNRLAWTFPSTKSSPRMPSFWSVGTRYKMGSATRQ